MRSYQIVAPSLIGAALLASGPIALATPTPRLNALEVRQIAVRAAQPYVDTNATTNLLPAPLTVARTQLGHMGKNLVWLARMHATVFDFPCKPPPLGAPAPSCPPRFSQFALVTIADATGRVLSIHAATSPCPGVPYTPPPVGASPEPPVNCGSGLVGIGNVGIPRDQLSQSGSGPAPSWPVVLPS